MTRDPRGPAQRDMRGRRAQRPRPLRRRPSGRRERAGSCPCARSTGTSGSPPTRLGQVERHGL